MKRIIPYCIKVRLHLVNRRVHDVIKGHYFCYAKKLECKNNLPFTLTIEQELKPNEAKKKNLSIAIKSIDSVQINPNEIFSFWKIIGNPSKKKGFVKSRSLVNGELEDSLGGGLCQLSGLIYYMSLYAKLEVLERHNHSLDFYNDETRFAPLGSDATVAFGYKDLKIRNNLKIPIKFEFSIVENDIIINLMSSDLIKKNKVEFKENKIDETFIEVETIINNEVVNKSKYKRHVP
jgi:vancomycin resistance protein VanW